MTANTTPTPAPAPEPVCACGHPKIDHTHYSPTRCFHVMPEDMFCECDEYRPAEAPAPATSGAVTEAELERLKQLCDKATPGPWEVWRGSQFEGGGEDMVIGRGEEWLANMDHRQPRCPQIFDDGHNMDECDICTIDSGEISREQEANANLIVAARTALPMLLDRAEADAATIASLREQVAQLEDVCAGIRELFGYEADGPVDLVTYATEDLVKLRAQVAQLETNADGYAGCMAELAKLKKAVKEYSVDGHQNWCTEKLYEFAPCSCGYDAIRAALQAAPDAGTVGEGK